MESKEITVIEKEPDLILVAQNIKGVSQNTKDTYTHAVKSYMNFLEDNKTVMGLDSMQAWIYSLESSKTQNVYLQAVKRVLRDVYEDDPRILELEKVFKKTKSYKVDSAIKEDDYITFKEFQKLIKKAPEKYALIIEAFFWTGCRVSELINIRLKDCAKTGKHYTITVIGKGSKQRDVFINVDLFNRVNNFFNGNVYLFEAKGKTFNRSFISNEIKKLGRSILDRKMSSHTLRHSKAMYLKDVKKLSPDQIAKALGHSSIITTMTHYFHGSPSAEDQGIE